MDLSYLYCGVGDARHLYTTLLVAGSAPRKFFQALQLTIIDLKAQALAKVLVLFDLVDAYNKHKQSEGAASDAALSVARSMAYIFAGHFYPSSVHNAIQSTLTSLIEKLEKGQPILPWLYVAEVSREPIIATLKEWKGPSVDAHNPKEPIDWLKHHIREKDSHEMLSALQMGYDIPKPSVPSGCEDDRLFFDNACILPPPKTSDMGGDELPQLLDAVKSKLASASSTLVDHVRQHWKANVTLFDLAWEKQWKSNPALKGDDEYLSGLLFDPLDVLGMVVGDLPPPKGPSPGVIDRLGMYFAKVADSITELSSILTIEVIHGEVADIMEKLTYDCFDYRLKAPGAAGTRPDPSKFHKKFDHIHLSNIP